MLLLFSAGHLTHAEQQFFARSWTDQSGKTRTWSDLREMLRKQQQWIESERKTRTLSSMPAEMDADLRRAKLIDANLINWDLSYADLTGADLTRANLSIAIMRGVNVRHANLAYADLGSANLTPAILIDPLRTASSLSDANLTHANLSGADLTDVWVDGANFDGAVFEPSSLPKLRGISRARNLELLTYKDNPSALVQLRKQFEDGGFREQERKITYALRRREAELSRAKGNFASFAFNKVFFDWTCQYGMSPGRPLMLGVVLWFLCSLLYFACIHTPGEAGLYRVYGQSIRDDPSAQRRVERISAISTTYSRGPRWLFQFFRRECLLLRTSMFFSLMSAFNIGFRDINFGRWLRLLTRQEFDIKAVGWARVIAGWQSLISVYLIALWVLTYFGRPFD